MVSNLTDKFPILGNPFDFFGIIVLKCFLEVAFLLSVDVLHGRKIVVNEFWISFDVRI